MSKRFLFPTISVMAHVNPVASIARVLKARGHEVAFVAHEASALDQIRREQIFLVEDETSMTTYIERTRAARGIAATRVYWEDVVAPVAEAMLPAVAEAAQAFQPDVIVSDEYALAGGVVARSHGIPWATSAPSGRLQSGLIEETPALKRWIDAYSVDLASRLSSVPLEWPFCSPDLVLCYTTPELVGPEICLPDSFRFVGPALDGRSTGEEFGWPAEDTEKRVLVSLGTLFPSGGEDFFRALLEALSSMPVQAIVTLRGGLDMPAPPNVTVKEWVPMLEALSEADALVCHAGTIMHEALFNGVPAVVAPISLDQFTYASQAVEAGSGVRVNFNRSRPDTLIEALSEVLYKPSYHDNARRIQNAFHAAGGAEAAATALEALAGGARAA